MAAYFSDEMHMHPDRGSPLDSSNGDHLTPATPLNDTSTDLDEIITSVMVEGTTFVAVYGVVDGFIELVSPDFGEGRAALAGKPADKVARNLLGKMAFDEILRTDIPFMPDHPLLSSKLVSGLGP